MNFCFYLQKGVLKESSSPSRFNPPNMSFQASCHFTSFAVLSIRIGREVPSKMAKSLSEKASSAKGCRVHTGRKVVGGQVIFPSNLRFDWKKKMDGLVNGNGKGRG